MALSMCHIHCTQREMDVFSMANTESGRAYLMLQTRTHEHRCISSCVSSENVVGARRWCSVFLILGHSRQWSSTLHTSTTYYIILFSDILFGLKSA